MTVSSCNTADSKLFPLLTGTNTLKLFLMAGCSAAALLLASKAREIFSKTTHNNAASRRTKGQNMDITSDRFKALIHIRYAPDFLQLDPNQQQILCVLAVIKHPMIHLGQQELTLRNFLEKHDITYDISKLTSQNTTIPTYKKIEELVIHIFRSKGKVKPDFKKDVVTFAERFFDTQAQYSAMLDSLLQTPDLEENETRFLDSLKPDPNFPSQIEEKLKIAKMSPFVLPPTTLIKDLSGSVKRGCTTFEIRKIILQRIKEIKDGNSLSDYELILIIDILNTCKRKDSFQDVFPLNSLVSGDRKESLLEKIMVLVKNLIELEQILKCLGTTTPFYSILCSIARKFSEICEKTNLSMATWPLFYKLINKMEEAKRGDILKAALLHSSDFDFTLRCLEELKNTRGNNSHKIIVSANHLVSKFPQKGLFPAFEAILTAATFLQLSNFLSDIDFTKLSLERALYLLAIDPVLERSQREIQPEKFEGTFKPLLTKITENFTMLTNLKPFFEDKSYSSSSQELKNYVLFTVAKGCVEEKRIAHAVAIAARMLDPSMQQKLIETLSCQTLTPTEKGALLDIGSQLRNENRDLSTFYSNILHHSTDLTSQEEITNILKNISNPAILKSAILHIISQTTLERYAFLKEFIEKIPTKKEKNETFNEAAIALLQKDTKERIREGFHFLSLREAPHQNPPTLLNFYQVPNLHCSMENFRTYLLNMHKMVSPKEQDLILAATLQKNSNLTKIELIAALDFIGKIPNHEHALSLQALVELNQMHILDFIEIAQFVATLKPSYIIQTSRFYSSNKNFRALIGRQLQQVELAENALTMLLNNLTQLNSNTVNTKFIKTWVIQIVLAGNSNFDADHLATIEEIARTIKAKKERSWIYQALVKYHDKKENYRDVIRIANLITYKETQTQVKGLLESATLNV